MIHVLTADIDQFYLIETLGTCSYPLDIHSIMQSAYMYIQLSKEVFNLTSIKNLNVITKDGNIPPRIKNMKELTFLCLNKQFIKTLDSLTKCNKLRTINMYGGYSINHLDFSKITITHIGLDIDNYHPGLYNIRNDHITIC